MGHKSSHPARATMHIKDAVARTAMEVVMVVCCNGCGLVAGNLPWDADRANLT
jgi:hypothetical protein